MNDLCTFTERGIYCPQGNFYIDPWQPVDQAIITHAHSDHARWGHSKYLAQTQNKEILKLRLGQDINLATIDYGETISMNGVKVSFHPAGHIWGSAQVRLEHQGQVWVISGDYKVENDGFSGSFEPVKCHTFITESTFGLPVFKWKPQGEVINEINDWWRKNKAEGKTSILCAYALGKAQRIIANVDQTIGTIYVQGAVDNVNKALQRDGAQLPETIYAGPEIDKKLYPGSLVITPSSSIGTSWMRKFNPYELATVSGWMQIRGIKRRRNSGHGFVLSDHADWEGLNQAVASTGAERVFVTHGYTDVFSRWLEQQGLESGIVKTKFEGELLENQESKSV